MTELQVAQSLSILLELPFNILSAFFVYGLIGLLIKKIRTLVKMQEMK